HYQRCARRHVHGMGLALERGAPRPHGAEVLTAGADARTTRQQYQALLAIGPLALEGCPGCQGERLEPDVAPAGALGADVVPALAGGGLEEQRAAHDSRPANSCRSVA